MRKYLRQEEDAMDMTRCIMYLCTEWDLKRYKEGKRAVQIWVIGENNSREVESG